MSYYQAGNYQKLYELQVTKEDGTKFGCGGLTPEKLSEYVQNAKRNGWKYEVIEEATQTKLAWA
jgi:hypothetical protein